MPRYFFKAVPDIEEDLVARMAKRSLVRRLLHFHASIKSVRQITIDMPETGWLQHSMPRAYLAE